ncbi:MAG: sigma-70 family RNA polymerase sigma factor [Chitinophagales bacterium]|nr:sigma-70 family RNA polymerase sigma factor [Chitinophagaceae bacterium]MCB9064590.1 sigma-70 family RNA polymerase sigma factor [Chitinophagales bacterium]
MPDISIHTNDNALLASFKDERSREAVFTVIVRKYQERLYWHIRRMVVEHEDTNDILQGVFIKMWHNLADFRGDSALFTWLYRITTNETLTWLEREKKRRNRSADYDEGTMSGRVTEQSGYDAQKIEWKLQQAMHALPEKQRLVFSLRYYDEMPYEEMSKVLNTSEGALKASYHHAVKKVEEHLKTH